MGCDFYHVVSKEDQTYRKGNWWLVELHDVIKRIKPPTIVPNTSKTRPKVKFDPVDLDANVPGKKSFN